ncbi:ArsC family reductase [Acetobacter sp. AN02]|uniref:ArsC family reductase n=1 Tax=Acetobacter sp. AN02 TaxID=2894186 RepID=UPI00243433A9|nr:ArsC family reductase [Acetobacter sp. AN02]MDG6095718.1 ArsC family reductase [Acetobacter sp. AN02]
MTLTLCGIRNCDTMKKARTWLDTHGIAFHFHDYKTDGITHDRLTAWADEAGWEALLNRKGTTFRKLPEAEKQNLDRTRAVALMEANPSMIRRPVMETPSGLIIGFSPDLYQTALTASGAPQTASRSDG